MDEDGYVWLAKDDDILRFKEARNGDHLMTPFQCDWCLFRVVTGRRPRAGSREDEWLFCILRRCNLDALWGRERSTVTANHRNVDQLVEIWAQLGVEPALPPLGPFPETDLFGVTVAIAMLVKSLNPGRYEEYTQFETMRKLRSAFSNLHHASAMGAASMMTLGRDTAKTFLSTCVTHSMWFERFSKGCFKRMGQITRQDLALSVHVMLALTNLLEQQWTAQIISHDTLAYVGAYICIAYGGSFRGNEVFLTDFSGLSKYASMDLIEDGQRYVIIPLLGRFKNEDGEKYHLTPLAYRTASGLPIGTWVSRLVEIKRSQHLTKGPAFSDKWGKRLSPQWLEIEVLDRLHIIQGTNPELIARDVNVYEDYGISRSFRRGATTQARNKKVDENDINAMNRWRAAEGAKGRRPRLRMQDHYSDIRQMVPVLLRFSSAL